MQWMKRCFSSIYRYFFKYRIRLLVLLLLSIFVAASILWYLSPDKARAAGWYDDDWLYRTAYSIGNTGSSDTDKKVKIDIDTATLITAGKMQSDCGDSRFTDATGNVLKYYIDTSGGACNGASTDYYILMESIPVGGSIIYHYYGNTSSMNATQSSQFAQSTFAPNSGPTAASEEQSPGPVAAWSFDEGYGTTTQDATANNNDGTLTNGPQWRNESECISGKCLYFDGSNDYVSVTNGGNIEYTNAFTISLWFYSNSLSAPDAPELFDQPMSGGWVNLRVAYNNEIEFQVKNATTTLEINSPNNTIETNKWYHLVAVYDPTGTTKLYVNGNQMTDTSTTNVGILTKNSYLRFGRGFNSWSWNGKIDEVRIYPFARSANQIKTDFASRGSVKGVGAQFGAGGPGSGEKLSQGLVGYWKMDESTWTNNCSTTSVTDSSGNGNNGAACPNSTGPTGGSAGQFGYGGSFDGTDDYVSVADPSSGALDFGSNTDFTLSAWVKPNSFTSTPFIIDKRGTFGGVTAGYTMYLDLSGLPRLRLANGSSVTEYTSGSTNSYSTGTWHHYIISAKRTGLAQFFVDGILIGSSDISAAGNIDSTQRVGLGTKDAISNTLNGSMDEARIYNRALSPAEVRALYNWAPGPVAHWKLDEKTGTSASDVSGNGNTGTLTNGPTWSQGKFGSAVSFDGSNDYVTAGDPAALRLTTTGSVSVWVNPRAYPGSGKWGKIVDKGNWGAGRNDYSIYFSDTSSMIRFEVDGASASQGVSVAYTNAPLNSWSYLTLTWDGSNIKAYINGILKGSTTQSISPDTSSYNLEINSSNSNFAFNGLIDDVRIYNYALNSRQIANIMNGQDINAPAVGSPVGHAVAYYSFDEGYGTTAQDKSQNNNDGTLTNMASPATSTSGWSNSGKYGKALVFDGTNDYVEVADNSVIDLTDAISISAWVKSDTAGQFDGILQKGSFSDNYGNYALWKGNNETIRFGLNNNAATVITSETISTGTWNHIVATYDKSQMKVFINGKQSSVTTNYSTSIATDNNPLRIGRYYSSSLNWSGLIDEVKIYNYALTEDEIRLEYNRGSAAVFGSTSTASNGTTADNSTAREYCVPGDTGTCNAPVAEWKLDEGTGTSANDTSGNANTGTLTNGPTWVQGKFGKAVSFDGSDDYITITDSTSLSPTSNLTTSFWIKSNSALNSASSRKDLIYKGTAYYVIFNLAGNDGKISFITYDGGNREVKTTTTSWLANTWYHINGTYDGSTLKIYVNGKLENTASYTGVINDSGNVLTFGSNAGSNPLDGLIDNVRIYNYARTPAQIAWEYNRGAPVAWYKFDECQGTTINDWAPNANGGFNGNNGTITIGATGTNTSAGTCTGSAGEAWKDGATGKINASLEFDGTDDYVSVTDANIFDIGTGAGKEFAISMWFKTNASGQTKSLIAKRNTDASSDTDYMLFTESNTLIWGTGSSTDSCSWMNVSEPSSSTWHHVVGTLTQTGTTSGTKKLFIDGIEKSSCSYNSKAASTNNNLFIGKVNGSDLFFSGFIDDVRIYNYALTPAQVRDVYNNGAVSFK